MLEGPDSAKWSSKFGFIMAAVGSAVGLGNIWRFPYVAGKYGGALFLLVYVVIVFTLGFTMLSAEIALGRHSGRSVMDTFKSGKKNWSFIGIFCLLICFLIVSYYSVIGGWLVKYFAGYTIGGGFVADGNYSDVFNGFVSSGVSPTLYNALFLVAALAVLVFGVKRGIEKASKILMPALFVMLVFVAIVALTMPGSIEGVKFFLVPDFDRIQESGGVLALIDAAMGQAFFSLSVGFGITCTYGSYLSKNSNIAKDSLTVCGFDTLVAVVAGFTVLPAVFSAGLEPTQGPGLLFVSLPAVFKTLGGFGVFVGAVFFLLVIFAALTSCISLLEVLIAVVEQKTGLKRGWSTAVVGAAVLAMGTVVSLSQDPDLFGFNLLDIFDLSTTKFLIPLTALFMCLYIGIVWKIENAALEINNEALYKFRWLGVWKVSVKYIAPLMIAAIFALGMAFTEWNSVSYAATGLAAAAILLTAVAAVFYNRAVKRDGS